MKNLKNYLIYLLVVGLGLFSCSYDREFLDYPNQGVAGSITRFATHKGYMYGLNLNEVQTYDLSNPDQPKLVHSLTTDYGLETITIYDNTIYLGSRTSLYILDISNPAVPAILSQTTDESLFGRCDPVTVSGQYAYSTAKIIANICGQISAESQLITYDVSNKSNPMVTSRIGLSMPNGLKVKDNHLFVCDEGSDMVEVFSLQNPGEPAWTTYNFALVDPVDLIVNGQKLIISTKTSFEIYDVTQIENIKRLGSISK